MSTELYLITTNPETRIMDLLRPGIFLLLLASIGLHVIIYASFFNVGAYVFYGKMLSKAVNMRLLGALTGVMVLGFIGRMMHVKEIYATFGNADQARQYVDKHYISWIFLS